MLRLPAGSIAIALTVWLALTAIWPVACVLVSVGSVPLVV